MPSWLPLPSSGKLGQSARWLAAQTVSFQNLIAGVMHVNGRDVISVNEFRTGFGNVLGLGGTAGTILNLTIASGVITVQTSYNHIDTEASAATDDLDTILTTDVAKRGDICIIRSVTSSRDITLTENGNIRMTSTYTSFTLDTSGDMAFLVFNSVNWNLMSTFGGTLAV